MPWLSRVTRGRAIRIQPRKSPDQRKRDQTVTLIPASLIQNLTISCTVARSSLTGLPTLYVVRMTGDRGNLTSFAFLDARNRSACRQNRRFVRRILSSRQNPSLQLVFPIYLLTSTRSQARIIRSEDYSKHASTSHRSPCTILLCHSVHKLACQVTDPGLAYMVVGGFVVAVSTSTGNTVCHTV